MPKSWAMCLIGAGPRWAIATTFSRTWLGCGLSTLTSSWPRVPHHGSGVASLQRTLRPGLLYSVGNALAEQGADLVHRILELSVDRILRDLGVAHAEHVQFKKVFHAESG